MSSAAQSGHGIQITASEGLSFPFPVHLDNLTWRQVEMRCSVNRADSESVSPDQLV